MQNNSKENIIMKAENLNKTFASGNNVVHAVNNMSFSVKEGELVVIVGPSGAGKSTLLNLIGGMDSATEGTLLIEGKDISKFNKRQLTEYRRNVVGFVFQFYNLMPNLTAKENIELSTELKKDALDPIKTLQEKKIKQSLS